MQELIESDSLANQMSELQIGSSHSSSGLVYHIKNAHRDDIHGMISVGNYLVTGSKDTSVKLWDFSGSYRGLFAQHPSTTKDRYSYKHWITALDSFSDGSILTGSRNGYVLCKNPSTKQVYYNGILVNNSQIFSNYEQNSRANYKQRNEPRITSVLCRSGNNYNALVGITEKFVQLNVDTGRVSRIYNFNSPEWVYGFVEIDLNNIAVIHACSLSLFREKNQNGWDKVDEVITEGMRVSGQRPFISDVNQFHHTPGRLSVAFFGGMTKVIDVNNKKKAVHQGNEHHGRVWKNVPVNNDESMSCADDGLVKFWDIRQRQSTKTYNGHPGRVSAVTLLPETNIFVAASCPENSHDSTDKGQLFFYDRRK